MAELNFDQAEFLKKYRGTQTFVETSKYYMLFLELLKNDELLEKIKFANDVLGIPPLLTFIKYERDYCGKDLFKADCSEKYIKQGLGACFGYLYRFMYGGYEPVQCWVNDTDTQIKTISKFIKI